VCCSVLQCVAVCCSVLNWPLCIHESLWYVSFHTYNSLLYVSVKCHKWRLTDIRILSPCLTRHLCHLQKPHFEKSPMCHELRSLYICIPLPCPNFSLGFGKAANSSICLVFLVLRMAVNGAPGGLLMHILLEFSIDYFLLSILFPPLDASAQELHSCKWLDALTFVRWLIHVRHTCHVMRSYHSRGRVCPVREHAHTNYPPLTHIYTPMHTCIRSHSHMWRDTFTYVPENVLNICDMKWHSYMANVFFNQVPETMSEVYRDLCNDSFT